jgi:UDP-2,3-diacylglucosamine hydrolase
VLQPPCYVFSDSHLGAASPAVERDVLSFLQALPGRAGSLIINGDLFDFWFEWKKVIPRRSFRILAALADFKDAGGEILWIAGNHDCWGGSMLRDEVGVDYHVGEWKGKLAGWRTRIEHGDGLRDKEDRGYRALRAVLRNRLAIGAFRWIHPDLSTWLASGSSQASRTYLASADRGAGLRSIAIAELMANKYLDLIIYGHSHVAALERAAPGRGVYANAGSWLGAPTFLVITPERIELRHWVTGADDAESLEGVCLDAIDRGAEKSLPEPA